MTAGSRLHEAPDIGNTGEDYLSQAREFPAAQPSVALIRIQIMRPQTKYFSGEGRGGVGAIAVSPRELDMRLLCLCCGAWRCCRGFFPWESGFPQIDIYEGLGWEVLVTVDLRFMRNSRVLGVHRSGSSFPLCPLIFLPLSPMFSSRCYTVQ